MAKRTPYDLLPIVPHLIADVVVGQPYEGQEISDAARDAKVVAEREGKRQALSQAQRDEFVSLADQRCRNAYEAGAKWFTKIVRSRTNGGRDQLYVWVRHWLAAYLHDPASLRRDAAAVGNVAA